MWVDLLQQWKKCMYKTKKFLINLLFCDPGGKKICMICFFKTCIFINHLNISKYKLKEWLQYELKFFFSTSNYFLLLFHLVFFFCLLEKELNNHSLEIWIKAFIMNHAWLWPGIMCLCMSGEIIQYFMA